MMNTRSAILSGSATRWGLLLLLAGGIVAGTVPGIATARGSKANKVKLSHSEKEARDDASDARSALAKGKIRRAIRRAEDAVNAQPQVADYRMVLGQSYLKAGRFVSARDAFADVLTLDPDNAGAALNLALMQIATGDAAGARKTLDAHANTVPVADRGLAIALAGDPVAAVELLGPATRAPDSDATVRQNFALSLALAGRWREAETVAAIDIAPANVAKRILEWSNFARPTGVSDQVASLLGVKPVADDGQPAGLALPARGFASLPAKAAEALATVAEANTAPPGGTIAAQEDVALPPASPVETASVTTAASAVTRIAAPARGSARGNFYVQLGAFQNADLARNAWARISRSYASFAGQTPRGMAVTANGKSLYRLSVGGFSRRSADAMCSGYRARGGTCFVRVGAGDSVAVWARGNALAAN